jgi:hypothetical protein
MSEAELELLEGLRELAAAEPKAASPTVEQALLASFRARNARRRRVVWGSAAGAFAAAAAVMTFFFSGPAPKPSNPVAHAIRPAAPDVQEASGEPQQDSDLPQARFAVVRTDDVASSFYPLPEAADLPAIETAIVVRVEMPASSLQFMGVLVGDDASADPVEADVLLGQDGLARGVRLIQ